MKKWEAPPVFVCFRDTTGESPGPVGCTTMQELVDNAYEETEEEIWLDDLDRLSMMIEDENYPNSDQMYPDCPYKAIDYDPSN